MAVAPKRKCDLCGKESAARPGILNSKIGGKLLKSFQYAVGLKCYRKQYKEVWPDEECPV